MHSTTLAHRSAGNGSLVVCLHSSGGSSGQWQALLAAGHDRRFVAPDFHGHGRSPQPPGDRDYSLSIESDAVVRLLRGVDHVDLVGHSYGAVVALDIARRLPRQVRSLALYEPVLFGILDHDSTPYRGDRRGQGSLPLARSSILSRRSSTTGPAAAAGPPRWSQRQTVVAASRRSFTRWLAVRFRACGRCARYAVLLMRGGTDRQPLRLQTGFLRRCH
jgi:pimeloyl-ACP methyl ester carboxylesterase